MRATIQDSWTACPPHVLAGFVSEKRLRSRRQAMVKISAVAATALGAGWLGLRLVREQPPAVFVCADVFPRGEGLRAK